MLRALLDKGLSAHLLLTDTQRIADWDQQLQGYRKKVLMLVSDLQLQNHVTFERTSLTDMPILYNRADVVVYPTIGDEPYGLVPLEAMSCARPIVGSQSGGIVETIVDGVTGFLVEPGDVDGLAERVAMLLHDTALATRFGEAGRRHVEQSFSAKKYVAAIIERYSNRATMTTAARHRR
jgi:glycosyltransferase involved in cell wall biosynthesis